MQVERRSNKYNLKDSPFFKLKTRKKLASILRISADKLAIISDEKNLYVRRWKHKEQDKWLSADSPAALDGSYRPIDMPAPRLKMIQRRIHDLFSRIQAPDFLFSFEGRSYVDNAAYHAASRAHWQLDVADYFPSCSAKKLANFFYRHMQCSEDVTAVIVKLVTFNGCLPQGSPCSPILAYYCNHVMWLEVERHVKSLGCNFSLYADDITISGDLVLGEWIWGVKRILHKNGLRLKDSKELSSISAPVDITGVIVNRGGIYLPNRQHKKLVDLRRARAETQDVKEKAKIDSRIVGRIAQKRQVESSPVGGK